MPHGRRLDRERDVDVGYGWDLLGWLGGALAATAYVLVSTGRTRPDAGLFQGLNIAGAALLCVASFHSGALPSATMNITWILFGAHSLVLAERRRRASARPSTAPLAAVDGVTRGASVRLPGEPGEQEPVLEAA